MIGGLNDNLGLVYPLVYPNEDLRGLFLDIKLAIEENSSLRLPFRIARIDVLQNTWMPGSSFSSEEPSGYGILIVDENGNEVFEGTASNYHNRSFSSLYFVHEWIKSDSFCSIVQRTDKDVSLLDNPYEPPGLTGIIDERAVHLLPPRLKSIRVLSLSLTGNIEFVSGFNAQFSRSERRETLGLPSTNSLLRKESIVLDLAPGFGEGRFPGCEEVSNNLNRINNQTPDENGNFRLEMTGCYQVYPEVEGNQIVAGKLNLENSCAPCCECDDYVNVYRAFSRLVDRYEDIGALTDGVKDRINRMRDRWEQYKRCSDSHPLKLMLVAPAAKRAIVSAVFCNTTRQCHSVLLRFNTTTEGGSADFVPGGVYVLDPLTGEWRNGAVEGTADHFSYKWSTLDPGQTVKIVVTFQFITDCPCSFRVAVNGPNLHEDINTQAIVKTVAISCETTGAITIV